MRILISAESFLPRSNGVSNSVLRAARYLSSAGHQVQIIAPGFGPNQLEEIEIVRVPALSFQKFAQVDVPKVRKATLVGIMERFQPDLVYLASPFFLGNQVRKAAKICGIPVIANFQTDVAGFVGHYGLSGAKKLATKQIRKIHSRSDITLAPSTASIKWLEEIGVTNIIRWGRGVDHSQFNPSWRSKEVRKSWGVDAQTCVIGFVGRLAPEKQVEKLLAISDIGHLSGRKVKFVIVGDGPSRKRVQRSLKEGLFLGHLSGEDLSRAMASMDILVTTGENETFCQVIQEAMASGLPVVAPEIGGPIDLIEHGVTGFLYKPGQNKSIRRAVAELIHDESERKRIASQAYDSVRYRTWENVCKELEQIMLNVIRRQSSTTRQVA